MKRLLQTLLGIAILASFASADTDSFTFTNNTGKDANDLHIEWSRAVTVTKCDKFKKFNDKERSNSDFSKGDVAKGDTCEVTVTYDGTDPKVKSFYWTKDGKNIGNGSVKDDLASVSTANTDGLTIITLTTGAGTIKTYLPDDMRPGDTISGTVIATPDPKNAEAGSVLSGTVLQLGETRSSAKNTMLIAGLGTAALTHLIFKSPDGHVIGTCPLPLNQSPISDPSGWIIGQSGRPLTIPFKNDPTKLPMVNFSGKEVPVIAGTPRCLVIGTPSDHTGAADIQITAGSQTSTVKATMLKLELTAPKTSLLRGEQVTIEAKIIGLDALSTSAPPIQVVLKNLTPETISFINSPTGNRVVQEFKPGSGTAQFKVTVQASQPGTFSVAGEIVADNCGETKTIEKIERLSKGKDDKGFFVKIRRDTYEGKCHKKKGHTGDHSYSWKKSKSGDEEVKYFDTEKERDDYYKEMEAAKAKIEKEMAG